MNDEKKIQKLLKSQVKEKKKIELNRTTKWLKETKITNEYETMT